MALLLFWWYPRCSANCLYTQQESKQMDFMHVKGTGKYWLLTHVWNVTPLTLGQEAMVGAMWKVIVSLILFMVSPGDGLFRSMYRTARVSTPFTGNAGQPLFLTPYIEAGNIKKGKCQRKLLLLLSFILFDFTATFQWCFKKQLSIPQAAKYMPVFFILLFYFKY